eukprot:763219-Hanusia_phi.AAC.3
MQETHQRALGAPCALTCSCLGSLTAASFDVPSLRSCALNCLLAWATHDGTLRRRTPFNMPEAGFQGGSSSRSLSGLSSLREKLVPQALQACRSKGSRELNRARAGIRRTSAHSERPIACQLALLRNKISVSLISSHSPGAISARLFPCSCRRSPACSRALNVCLVLLRRGHGWENRGSSDKGWEDFWGYPRLGMGGKFPGDKGVGVEDLLLQRGWGNNSKHSASMQRLSGKVAIVTASTAGNEA